VKASDAFSRFQGKWLITGILMLAAVCSAVCCKPQAASAADTLILSVTLNTVSHGEFFLKRSDSGTLLMRREDLQQIGLKTAAVSATTLDSEDYISLSDLPGLTVTVDEKLLLLDLLAGAALVDLPRIVRNYSPVARAYVPTQNTSAFLNYRIDYSNGIDVHSPVWSGTAQAGLRRGNLLLLGDGYFQRSQETQQAVRLMTNLSWDRPAHMSRWVAGDISASSGEPSGPILMGGLNYSTAFSIAPGTIMYPMGEFGGVATTPSEADIYVNGILVRRERLAPGDYRFRNLPFSSGANNVEILLRDSFGNEKWSSTRFYLSDQLLAASLNDYSYSIGFMRHDFGSASNHYGRPLLIGKHLFGINDSLTVGAGVEVADNLISMVPRAVISLSRVGVMNILAGASVERERDWGTTLGIGYQFQSRQVNYTLSLSHSSREFRTLSNQQAADTSRLECGTGISVGSPSFGTVSLNGSYSETWAGQFKRSLVASYSRTLAKRVQFTASVNSTWGTFNSLNFFTGLTFFPMKDLTASATVQTGPGVDKETVSLQKSLPVGEGVGYRATIEREQSRNQTLLRANPYLQINTSIGSYTADLQGQYNQQNSTTEGSYLVSAAGALVYAGGHVGLSRPVSSSFAVVQVEGMADVTVVLDNQEVARTNANGMAYIPNLQSYQENVIAFKDQLIEANYLIKRYKTIVNPGIYGGECIYFPVARIQAYGGRLLTEDGQPLEYAMVTLRSSDTEFSFTTLRGGEFYFENLVDSQTASGTREERCGDPSPYRLTVVPGIYTATVADGGPEQHFTLHIPISDAIYVALGEFRLPSTETDAPEQ
jgi:outer membrane usher protein